MGGFKLIAITPLAGCSSDFRKNLEIGTPYRFYKNYDIILDVSSGKVESLIEKESSIPEDFYQLKNGIKLNVSAVVGKNGSGKSTIFELLFYLMSVIATDKSNLPNSILLYSQLLTEKRDQLLEDYSALEKIINPSTGRKIIEQEIDFKELEKLGFKSLSALFFMLIKKHDLQIDLKASDLEIVNAFKIWSEIKFQKVKHEKLIEEEQKKEQKIRRELNLSLIYQIDDEIFEIEYINGNFKQYKLKPYKTLLKNSLEEFSISDLFYSIAINYSHHALNSNSIGNWINQLFHKNDAYITPVVINPMREEGNFNINHELSLSKERLMSNVTFNLVNNKEFKLLNKYKISKFIFTPKPFLSYVMDYGKEIKRDSTLNSLIIEELSINSFNENIDYWDYAMAYLEKKLIRISENYSFLIYSNKNSEDPLLDFIKNDNTHICKKVRQTLNFLKSTKKNKNRKFWRAQEYITRIELSTNDYLKWVESFELILNELKPSDLIEYALPGFFNVDFEFTADSGKVVEFSKLSSGEQQMILNTNSILYHLYNLQSVHNNHRTDSSQIIERIKYKDVNIVLDEVELYYHPEMQRQLVKNVIENLELVKVKDEDGITSINICFLTHSPFILSDIPSENVLRLDSAGDGKGNILEETFAANINDLLASGFFMETLIGQFAEDKITKVIENLSQNNLKEDDQQVMDIIGDSFLKASITQYKENLDD